MKFGKSKSGDGTTVLIAPEEYEMILAAIAASEQNPSQRSIFTGHFRKSTRISYSAALLSYSLKTHSYKNVRDDILAIDAEWTEQFVKYLDEAVTFYEKRQDDKRKFNTAKASASDAGSVFQETSKKSKKSTAIENSKKQAYRWGGEPQEREPKKRLSIATLSEGAINIINTVFDASIKYDQSTSLKTYQRKIKIAITAAFETEAEVQETLKDLKNHVMSNATEGTSKSTIKEVVQTIEGAFDLNKPPSKHR